MPGVCRFVLIVLMTLAVSASASGCGSEASHQVCEATTCGDHGTCHDASGDILCSCDDGYEGNNCDTCSAGYHDDGAGECVTDDPCVGTTVCADLQRECLNDQGTAVCGPCLDGYTDYGGGECLNDDPCDGITVCADLLRECINDEGTAVCGPCLDGFSDYGDGDCRPDDPCASDVVCSSELRECLNDEGVAVCGQCITGYTDYGDGDCRPSDPCANDTLCASDFRECVNDQGVAVCGECVSGYVDDGGICVEGCTPTPNVGVQFPFDLLILMDRSSSMTDAGKWGATESGVNAFLSSTPAAGLSVGIQYFPVQPSALIPTNCASDSDCGLYGPCLPSFNLCMGSFSTDTSCDPADYSGPDVPITSLPAAVTAIQTSLANHIADGAATPLQPALDGVLQDAVTWAQNNSGHRTHVVLITDGEPTGCMWNTIADAANLAQAAAGGTSPVMTFVIGIGSQLGALDPIALAGGTGQMHLVDINGNIALQVTDALNTIRAHGYCRYEIPSAVINTGDYHLVDVTLSDSANPPNVTDLTPVADATGCDPTNGGWHYDDVAAPAEIRLCTASCDAMLQGSLGVDVLVGCDPLTP